MQTQPTPLAIRRILDANAVFSATGALIFFVAARPLAAFLGASQPFKTGLSLGMLAYAALIAFNTSRPLLKRSFVFFTVIGDTTWVLLSILLIVTPWLPFTSDAHWAIGLTAICVDVFATLQFLEWRKM